MKSVALKGMATKTINRMTRAQREQFLERLRLEEMAARFEGKTVDAAMLRHVKARLSR